MLDKIFCPYWCQRIKAIYIAKKNFFITPVWRKTNDGHYSVKSGYIEGINSNIKFKTHRLRASKGSERFPDFIRKKEIWKLPGPQVWKTFAWKILTSALPIGEERKKRNLPGSFNCVLCAESLSSSTESNEEDCIESMEHLFRDCPISARIWASSCIGIRVEVDAYIPFREWFMGWVSYLNKSDTSSVGLLHFLNTLYSIWLFRNGVTFKKWSNDTFGFWKRYEASSKELNIFLKDSDKTQEIAKTSVEECNYRGPEIPIPATSARSELDDSEKQMQRLCGSKEFWIIKQTGLTNVFAPVKMQVDAGWLCDLRASGGWTWTLSDGEEGEEAFQSFMAESPIKAEGVAILHAIRWIKRKSVRHICIMSDCLQLVSQIVGSLSHRLSCQLLSRTSSWNVPTSIAALSSSSPGIEIKMSID